MLRKGGNYCILAVLAASLVTVSGCGRATLNYQISEAIGTTGMYENNEPVETPKMKAERQQKESEEALEAEKQKTLDTAARMAQEYRYEEAAAYLESAEALAGDARAEEAAAEYREAMGRLYEYEGDIPHFSFSNLVIDTSLAFDGDEYEQNYRSNMITLTEFQNILQALYENGYILIDIHDLAKTASGDSASEPENGGAVADGDLVQANPVVPQGKKPMILSIDNLSYSSVRRGDGVAHMLCVGSDGMVDAVYTDAEGHDLKGDYDVIPVLEAFIAEHPDFSYRGARGIISVAGSRGVFGYAVENTEENAENRETVKEIAGALLSQGWTFASAGYGYQYMSELSFDALSQDIADWLSNVGTLVGDCDTLIYPYGSEVDYSSEKAALLVSKGFQYLVGLWAQGDHVEVNPDYLRQTRRMVSGYVFTQLPNAYDAYFSVSTILDPER